MQVTSNSLIEIRPNRELHIINFKIPARGQFSSCMAWGVVLNNLPRKSIFLKNEYNTVAPDFLGHVAVQNQKKMRVSL